MSSHSWRIGTKGVGKGAYAPHGQTYVTRYSCDLCAAVSCGVCVKVMRLVQRSSGLVGCIARAEGIISYIDVILHRAEDKISCIDVILHRVVE